MISPPQDARCAIDACCARGSMRGAAPVGWRIALLGLVCLWVLTGCATVSPRDALATLDTRSPLYNTEECQRARRMAERFEDRDLARGGAGVAAGVVVGVVAAPIMGVIEADAVTKKEAMVAKLRQACETPVIIDATDPDRRRILPARQAQALEEAKVREAEADLQASRSLPVDQRLARLDALLQKGLISPAEHQARRQQILSGL